MEPGDFFKRIDSQYNQQLPFVVYRKPYTHEVMVLLQKNDLLFTTTSYSESGFVFAPFDNKEDTVLIPLEHSEKLSLLTEEAVNPITKGKSKFVEEPKSKAFHIDLVKSGIGAIKKGNLRKVVLSRTETVKIPEAKPLEIFKGLLSNYPTAFVYCFYHPKVGLWLGATPETLLKIEGHKFFTTALAGTQKYEGNLDVEWHAKEKEEQNMVTQFVIDHLQPLVKHLSVDEVKTARAGTLLHLKTNISGTLDFKNIHLNKILSTLHPTPAVCGVPKEEAKNFILEHEQYHREFYTGFLGELNFKEKRSRNANRHNVENDAYATVISVSNLYVNLRCVQIKGNEALIYVGGGITKDSNPEGEWMETLNKTQTIKSVL